MNTTDIKKSSVSINGTELYCESAGSGMPLIFIHGYSLDHRMWDNQFSFFAEKYHVLRYDLRGFGKSALPDGTPYSHHEDLKALLDHFNIPQAVLIGLSMGGRVATDFTLQYPEYVSALIPVDSVLHGYKNQFFFAEKVAIAAKERGAEAAKHPWLDHELFAPANAKPEVAVRLREMIHDFSGWHWINPNPWIPLSPPSLTQLHKITTPTLVIVGEQDLQDFHIIAGMLTENISGAKKAVIPNACHMSNMEEPTVFNSVVEKFLIQNQL
jgi:pimeloyl-ACP methyl ester carboxylesterase